MTNIATKIITILGVLGVVVSLFCSCSISNKPSVEPEPTSENVVGQSNIAHLTCDVGIVDRWTNETQNGVREYYVTLFVTSSSFYANIKESDILFLDKDYKALSEVIPNSEIVIENRNNDSKQGICAFVKIKTDKMIDTKKVFVRTNGPVKYEDGVQNEQDFFKKHGRYPSDSEWGAIVYPIDNPIIVPESLSSDYLRFSEAMLASDDT